MNKKYLISGFLMLAITFLWAIFRTDGIVKGESTRHQKDSSARNSSSSKQQDVRSSSRGVKGLDRKTELSAEDKAIYRARGYLKPHEVDPSIHTKVDRYRYTERVKIEKNSMEKILAEVAERDRFHDKLYSEIEWDHRDYLARLIMAIVEKGESVKEESSDSLEDLLGGSKESYEELDKAVADVLKQQDIEGQKNWRNHGAGKSPLRKEEIVLTQL